jgi:hypothetical protein
MWPLLVTHGDSIGRFSQSRRGKCFEAAGLPITGRTQRGLSVQSSLHGSVPALPCPPRA